MATSEPEEKDTDVIVKVFDLDDKEKVSFRCRGADFEFRPIRWEGGECVEYLSTLTADGPFRPYIVEGLG